MLDGVGPIHPLRTHPLRDRLVNEVHARPTMPLTAPQSASHLAVVTGEHAASEIHDHLVLLCERHRVVPPTAGADYFIADLGTLQLRWERHTEFVSYTFCRRSGGENPFAEPPIEAVPRDWLATLPGEMLVALHVSLMQRPEGVSDAETAFPVTRLFAQESLIDCRMAGGIATGFTDCHIHADGFGRILVLMDDEKGPINPHQTGRMVQRLLEIETYRTMALLGLPHAREAAPRLAEAEQRLGEITTALAADASHSGNIDRETDRALLDRLAGLSAEIERLSSQTSYRFSATSAYAALVTRRISELREDRLLGLQTYGEFMERQLQPAIRTCESVAARQEMLARRLARACQMLRARIEVTLQQQNRDLLHSMDQRAHLQLRLQETVEGLSVVAISYYAIALIGHVIDALAGVSGRPWLGEVGAGLAVPVVVGIVWIGIRRIRRRIAPAGSGHRNSWAPPALDGTRS
ncbi:MAG: DUF3422 domain-containing protein [Acetobacteraceae bacterium]|nr:DUF3422 domain-containing protein [Acetobacteraceae bacterium]